jgi:hypothetical protein
MPKFSFGLPDKVNFTGELKRKSPQQTSVPLDLLAWSRYGEW